METFFYRHINNEAKIISKDLSLGKNFGLWFGEVCLNAGAEMMQERKEMLT